MVDHPLPIGPKKNVIMPMAALIAIVFFAVTVTWKVSGEYKDFKGIDAALAKSVDSISVTSEKILKRMETYEERLRDLEMNNNE